MITIPDGPGASKRTRWTLEELLAHWSSQGLKASDALILASTELQAAERPPGLTLVPDEQSRVAWREDEVSPAALTDILDTRVSVRDLSNRLWLSRDLNAWLVNRIKDGVDRHEQLASPTGRPSFDAADELLLQEMRQLRLRDPDLSPWDAAGTVADRAQGRGNIDSRRRRLVRKYREYRPKL